MKNRTVSLDRDLVDVLQSKKGEGTTWNEYLSSLIGYSSFAEFKKFNSTKIVNENQLEIDLGDQSEKV